MIIIYIIINIYNYYIIIYIIIIQYLYVGHHEIYFLTIVRSSENPTATQPLASASNNTSR